MTYAKSANVAAAIAVRPAASPSSPSVRFTALLVPVRMNATHGTYSHANIGTTSRYL